MYDIRRYRNPASNDKDPHTQMGILISGDWGTGKTSAMKWLKTLLHAWNNHAGDDDIKVRPVWFFPWKYDNKEDVWRGIIAEVILQSLNVFLETQPEDRTRVAKAVDAARRFGPFLGRVFLHALRSLTVTVGIKDAVEVESDLGKTIKTIEKEIQETFHPEKAFLNEFETTLRNWVDDTVAGKHRNDRMVIFIDDLDRCMPDVALQVLEALKLYLNIERLIFVVGVDRKVVENLVVEHYRKLGLVTPEEKNETEHKEQVEKAKQYLSKMFQLEVEIAPSDQQITRFLDEQLKEISYWNEPHLSENERELFRGIIYKLAQRNPREVKRLINSALMMGPGAVMIKSEKGGRGI